jgi:shikimate dehydrogenase
MRKEFGLVGRTLKHSFSKEYFHKKFEALQLNEHVYQLFELKDIADFKLLMKDKPDLCGLNVTIPYKELIIPFLDELDEEASIIGAVNCIKVSQGKLKGFNTDAYGFKQSIKPFLEPKHERALILGTGGSSKAIAHALKSVGVDVYYVTRCDKKNHNSFLYNELNEVVMRSFKLIVNTTPLGMFPSVAECADIPYRFIDTDHLCYDLIYNPHETLFLHKAKEKGAMIVNGLSMLQLQAERSWEIWQQPE